MSHFPPPSRQKPLIAYSKAYLFGASSSIFLSGFILLFFKSGRTCLAARKYVGIGSSSSFHNLWMMCVCHLRFRQVVQVKATYPFVDAEEALENCQAIANGESTETLRNFLDQNLPKKRKKCQLGVLDPLLGKDLARYDFPILYEKNMLELTRLCRVHIKRYVYMAGRRLFLLGCSGTHVHCCQKIIIVSDL